jgi:general secretion pathway protein C
VALDPLLKKYFAVVVLGLLALAAYFQASGAAQLFGAALVGSASPPSSAAPSRKATAPVKSGPRRTADAILKRNPFDSITGPLTDDVIDDPELPTSVRSDPAGLADPLGAQPCSDVRVSIVTESTDPLWSFAALQGPGDQKPTLRRVGDTIGSNQVTYIGFNPREGSPAVWLMDGPKLCQALLFSEQPKPTPAAGKPGGKPSKAKARRKRGPPPVPKDIASKIKKVSPTEFHVDRAVLDKILENQVTLMRSARIVPEQKDGKTVGIRLFGIRPETLLGTLGLQNGDRLEAINGFPMASPEKALEAYARLRKADNLNVQVTRRGKPMSIDYRIK